MRQDEKEDEIRALEKFLGAYKRQAGKFYIYSASLRRNGQGTIVLAGTSRKKYLLTKGFKLPFAGEYLEAAGMAIGIYETSHQAAEWLREAFPFTAPIKLPPGRPSFGFGDRLGLANPGHARIAKGYGELAIVLAQQSRRELNLTGRDFKQVVDAATWAVFQEGYESGFGADGDHLKNLDEVEDFLRDGATMITLDLSLCLGKKGDEICPDGITDMKDKFVSLPGGMGIRVEAGDVERFWETYGASVEFVRRADELCRRFRGPGGYDLEISVDETNLPTNPVDHLLLARTLGLAGISPASIAPKYPGEFEKGIDYKGDLEELEKSLRMHAAVASFEGHKLSIHSGSDKFSAFPLIAKTAGKNVHVKTAGTSWLEALRITAEKDKEMFARIYERAKEYFPQAKKYYHIRTELEDIPPVIKDIDMKGALEREHIRQYLHIVYGQVLQAKDLGPALLGLLQSEEKTYYEHLAGHFKRHFEGLGFEPSGENPEKSSQH